jgi:hypothetical protein
VGTAVIFPLPWIQCCTKYAEVSLNLDTLTMLIYVCIIYRPGSIIANVSLNFDSNSNVSIAGLNKDVNSTGGKLGDLTFDPTTSAITGNLDMTGKVPC